MWNATLAISYCTEHFNGTDLQESCYIEKGALGDQEMPKMKVLGTTIYGIIFCTGLFGNITTCLVIRKHRLLRTSTNVYLFNLAIADLVTLITGLSFEIYMVWRPYPWDFPAIFCHLKAWFSETTSYGSVLTILAFSFERYLAVCHSFSLMKFSDTRKRLKIVLTSVWLVAGVCAAPFGVLHQVDYAIRVSPFRRKGLPIERSKMCAPAFVFDFSLVPMFDVMFHVSATMFFVLPMVVLFWIYRKVFLAVQLSRRTIFRRSTSHSLKSTNGKTSQDYHSRKVLIILVAVVSGFFACYAPFQVQRLMFIYVNPEVQVKINQYLFWISGFLFYFSATLNPIMYNLISSRYRRAFKETLCAKRQPTSAKGSTTYYVKMYVLGRNIWVTPKMGRASSLEKKPKRRKVILIPQDAASPSRLRDKNMLLQNKSLEMMLLDSMAKYDVIV